MNAIPMAAAIRPGQVLESRLIVYGSLIYWSGRMFWRYRILLHVHNEDVYKVFDMHVNNVARKVRILFNPNDLATERGQRIDLIVKRQGQYESSAVTTQ